LGSAEAHANRNLVTFAENIDNLFVGVRECDVLGA
jgi:hypothetical protein